MFEAFSINMYMSLKYVFLSVCFMNSLVRVDFSSNNESKNSISNEFHLEMRNANEIQLLFVFRIVERIRKIRKVDNEKVCLNVFSDCLVYRVAVGRWEEMWDPTSFPFPHGGREEIFFNFPFHMREEKRFFSVSLLTWKKKWFFIYKKEKNDTFSVGRKDIFFNFPSHMGGRKELFFQLPWEGKRFSSHFPSQRPPCSFITFEISEMIAISKSSKSSICCDFCRKNFSFIDAMLSRILFFESTRMKRSFLIRLNSK